MMLPWFARNPIDSEHRLRCQDPQRGRLRSLEAAKAVSGTHRASAHPSEGCVRTIRVDAWFLDSTEVPAMLGARGGINTTPNFGSNGSTLHRLRSRPPRQLGIPAESRLTRPGLRFTPHAWHNMCHAWGVARQACTLAKYWPNSPGWLCQLRLA